MQPQDIEIRVCMHAGVQVRKTVCVHACGGQRTFLGVSLRCYLPVWREGLSLGWSFLSGLGCLVSKSMDLRSLQACRHSLACSMTCVPLFISAHVRAFVFPAVHCVARVPFRRFVLHQLNTEHSRILP